MKKFTNLASVILLLLSFVINADNELSQNKQKSAIQLKTIKSEASNVRQANTTLRSDSNSARNQSKPPLPSPVPIPYPVISNTNDNTQKNSNRRRSSNDRFANQQSGHNAYSVPLENATVSDIRTEQLDNKQRRTKSVQLRQPIGAKCNPLTFPKNAAVKKFGKWRLVECVKNKTRERMILRSGVPATNNKKQPRIKIKRGALSDEMPEDLPAG